MRKYYELGPFTIFDVETTGMSAVNDCIVEIAALRVDLDGTVSRYQTLVNPNCHISSRVSRVHHIVDDMVKDAPHFRQVGYEFLDFARNSTLGIFAGEFIPERTSFVAGQNYGFNRTFEKKSCQSAVIQFAEFESAFPFG